MCCGVAAQAFFELALVHLIKYMLVGSVVFSSQVIFLGVLLCSFCNFWGVPDYCHTDWCNVLLVRENCESIHGGKFPV